MANRADIEARAVIGDRDTKPVTAQLRSHANGAFRRFSLTSTLGRRFEPVIDRVANEVQQWLAQGVENCAVGFDLLAFHHHPHFLADTSRDIARRAGRGSAISANGRIRSRRTFSTSREVVPPSVRASFPIARASSGHPSVELREMIVHGGHRADDCGRRIRLC